MNGQNIESSHGLKYLKYSMDGINRTLTSESYRSKKYTKQKPFQRRTHEVFRRFPLVFSPCLHVYRQYLVWSVANEQSARNLIDGLLALNPRKRMTAKDALDSDYFWEEPMPCSPQDLPKYEPSHEFQTRKRRQVRLWCPCRLFWQNAYYSVPTLFQLEVDVVKPSAVQPTGEGSLLWLIAGFSYLKSLSLRNVYGWTNHSNSQAKNWRLGIQIIATCSPKRRRNMVDTSIPVHLDPGHEPRVLVEPSGPARTTDNCDHVGLVRTPVGDSLFVNMHGRNLVVLFQLFVANTPYSARPILRETTCKDVTLTWYRQSGITVYSFHTLFHTLSGFSPRSSPGLSPIFFPQWFKRSYLRTLYINTKVPSYFETDYDGAKILIIAIYLLAFVAQVIKDLVYSGILENKTYSKMTTTDNKKKASNS